MKKMIAVAAVLAVGVISGACGGKKATNDDCAKAIEKANAVSADEMKKMNFSDEVRASIKAITLKHCTDDKWDGAITKCLSEAKNNEETLKCTDRLDDKQKQKWQTDMANALPKPPPETGSGSAEAGSAGSAGSGSGSGSSAGVDLPTECQDYKAMMARLGTCEKLGAARAAFQQAYDKVSASWATAGTTPEAKAQLALGCKTTVAAIRESAAATCGW